MSVLRMKGVQPVPEAKDKTYMEMMLITPDGVKAWRKPPFQRPLRVNAKVLALVEQLKREQGAIPGVITLGVLDRERYIVDGQHRIEAFMLSKMDEAIVDVRVMHFDTMGEMGDEFVKLNSRLVTMRPDDFLRGMEAMSEGLTYIRKHCPYIGYDFIRRSKNGQSPMVSMSLAIRAWFSSATDVPRSGGSAVGHVAQITLDEAKMMSEFYSACVAAWGRDAEYARLWSALNITLCAWLWRRLVVTQYSPATVRLTSADFIKCLMALSANAKYTDWLQGRNFGDRDRGPAFHRIKIIFARRIQENTGKQPRLPAPSWASNATTHALV